MDVSIHQATVKDFEIIQKLNAELFASDSANDDALDMNWPFSPAGIEYYKKSLEDPEKIVLLAKKEKREAIGYLIGCARNKFAYRTVKTGELENMYVLPTIRRQGIGRLLIQKLLEWLKTHNVDRLYVSAYAKNVGAMSFYRKIGFMDLDHGFELPL